MKTLTNLLESTEDDTNTLFLTLGETYEQLKLENVPIPDEIQVKVEKKLLELTFSTKNIKSVDDEFKLFKHVKEHLDFTCDMIDKFLSKYLGTEFEVDLEYVFRARYIAQNMSVLKRRMDYTYEILPWEEMQFCLVMYLYSLTNSIETDIIYKLILDRNRVLKHLFYFYSKLKEVQKNFVEENLKIKKSVNRNLIKHHILEHSGNFKGIYEDFSILRDVFSLNKIKIYLDQALSINLTQNNTVGRLVIERTLQVMGEYLKNTVESPNLSDDLYKLLMRSAPRNLRSILANVRNMLSHAFSLTRKLELEDSNDTNFFTNVQNDLVKVHEEIIYIIYQQKINAIKMFLSKILNQHTIEEIQFIFKQINIEEVKINVDNNLNSQDFLKVSELIDLFCKQVLEQSSEDTDLIKDIERVLESYNTKINNVSLTYVEGIKKLFKLQQNTKDLLTIHNIARTYLSTLVASEPQSLFNEIFKKLHTIYENFKRMRNYDPDNFLEPDDESIKLGKIIIEIYNNLKWGMRRIKWIEEIENKLTLKTDVNEEQIKKISNIFKAVEGKIEKEEEKDILHDAIVQKTKLHFNKAKIINPSDQDAETFESIVKSLNLSAKREKEVLNNFEKKKFDRLQLLIKEINDDYGTLIKQLGDLFPLNKYTNSLKTFFNSLKLKKALQVKILKAVNHVVQEEVTYSYSKRLQVLKKLMENTDFHTIKINKDLKTAMEMLVLDLTEYLENVKLLGDNKLFLIESLPILKGKQLRNYLAHGDILTEILPYNPLVSISFYAEKLIYVGEGILTQNDILLGHKINHDLSMQDYFEKCLKAIRTQDTLLDCIKKNDKISEIVENGAALNGTSLNGCTALDFSIYGGSLELFKFFLESNEKPIDIIHDYLKAAVISDQFVIMEYIINNFKVNLNYKYQNNMTLLHIALKYGHTRISNFLLKNNVNIYDKTTNNKTTLLFASESGTKELVLSLLDTDAGLIDLSTNDNTTALHLASQNNHSEVVQVLLDKNANPYIENEEGLTAFELAAQFGHQDILKIFLQAPTFNLPFKLINRAIFLAAESGHLNTIWPLFRNHVDINTINSNGETVLHRAAFYGHKKDVEILIRNDANVESGDNNGYRGLHLACQCGHVEAINVLLQNGADINAKDNKNWTPLHWATENSHQNVVKLLLSKNANIDMFDKQGKAALHIAAENCNIDIFNILLEETGNANTRTKNGESALHLAAEHGHSDIINILLDISGTDVNAKMENDETPLILAAISGHFNVIEQLLKHGANVNDKSKKEGYTALTRAAEQGFTDIVTILIKNNADIELQETSGWRALHLTVQNGYIDILEILLKNNVDVNSKYAKNGTALLTAIHNGHTDIVEKLIKFGADINAMMLFLLPLRVAANFGHNDIILTLIKNGANVNACGKDDVTPLHSATWNGHLETVILLLENGANVNSKTEEQWTALHFAAKFGHYDIVRLLVDKGADINSKNNTGSTAFHMSCETGHNKIVTMLLETGKIDVDFKNSNGWTSLYWACANGHINIVDTLLNHGASVNVAADDASTPLHWAVQYTGSIDIVNTLIKHNAVVNVIDAKGSTPLHLAALNGNTKVVEALLKNNADINAENNKVTALHLAATFGHYEITRILLDNGADMNGKGLYQKTALHLAADKGHKEIVQVLLEKRADVNARDQFNKIPLHLAVQNGHDDIVKFLLRNHSNINIRDNGGYTPLHLAIDNNRENIAVLLLANNANIEIETCDNSTILHLAVRKGFKQVVSALISQGVNLDATYSQNKITALHESLCNGYEDIALLLMENKANINTATLTGWTPLHVAAGKGYKKVFDYLVKARADTNAETADRETPLFFASLQGHYDFVLELLKNNADVNIPTKSKGWTPLSVAAQEGHTHIITLLIKYNADVNVKGDQYLTPLHLSALYGHEMSVKILLEHNANINAKTYNNWTPLHLAASEGYANIVKLLLENNFDNLEERTQEEDTPLLLAIEQGHKDVVQELLKYEANVTIKGKNALTSIELATQKGFTDIAEILLENIKEKTNVL